MSGMIGSLPDPARDYWSEFAFEGHVNRRTEAIFLAGLHDVSESRPHSKVNSPTGHNQPG
jgi:hypothetical protein